MQAIKNNERNIHNITLQGEKIYLYLLMLRARWLEANQLTIKELSLLIRVCISVLRKHGVKLVVSSASNMKRESCEIKGRSLICTKTIKGPKMYPCGIPDLICFKVDLSLPI